jgi:DNA-binding GntR family transcriptional regulator
MADVKFDPATDTTRRAEVVGKLRRAILNGQLRPGEKVNELRIAEQMRISRAPLREAIRELVQEGLLTNIPYAGAYVIAVTAKDIEDAYSFHHALEEFALDRVWPIRDERFRAELDRRHLAVKTATEAVDLTGQIEAALKLHGLIYEWADNALVLDAWLRLANRLQMIFALHQQARDEPVPEIDMHEDYVRLLKGDDLAAAKAHAHEHIDWNFEELLAYARSLEEKKA